MSDTPPVVERTHFVLMREDEDGWEFIGVFTDEQRARVATEAYRLYNSCSPPEDFDSNEEWLAASEEIRQHPLQWRPDTFGTLGILEAREDGDSNWRIHPSGPPDSHPRFQVIWGD